MRHGQTHCVRELKSMESWPETCSTSSAPARRLTVWRKSLLFNSHGYTVFDDADGRIVFRVDNYAHDWRRHTLLMDSHGNVLLTIRRCRPNVRILNLRESWKVYEGDEDTQTMSKDERLRPLFKATKHLGSSSCSISMFADRGSVKSLGGYRMSWSREKEWSKIYQADPNTLVAEVSRKYGSSVTKNLLDKDVLALTVHPGMDQALTMAMIMITNSMSG
ncbi:protein LURP-one-related 5-like isoform X1 [Zingiber officinale]|uniref:protein LURP-one-related 5-like isoform X1 n=1 Tax=Zingiber officinale TaxID=94328 RepID=UPI001C4CFA5B|nr:protein LURP-one-related 5-like isoform X1 [Zingiber officinale]